MGFERVVCLSDRLGAQKESGKMYDVHALVASSFVLLIIHIAHYARGSLCLDFPSPTCRRTHDRRERDRERARSAEQKDERYRILSSTYRHVEKRIVLTTENVLSLYINRILDLKRSQWEARSSTGSRPTGIDARRRVVLQRSKQRLDFRACLELCLSKSVRQPASLFHGVVDIVPRTVARMWI